MSNTQSTSDTPDAGYNEHLDLGQGVFADSGVVSFGDVVSIPMLKEDSDGSAPEVSGSKEQEDTPRPCKESEWQDKPTYADQLERYPEQCRSMGPFFKQFDAVEQEEELGTFMMKAMPREAPAIIVHATDKQFSTATESWKILVTYSKIQYRKLLSKGPKI